MLDCFGVRFVSPFLKKSQTLKMAKKPGKLDKHGHNFVTFSQATGQTWNHTSAYHLSTLGKSDPRCAICKEGHFSTSITSHHNSKTHNIKQSVTCKSNNVCYLIDCSKCKQQYVGETELEFHCRMNNHKSDIRLENKSNGMVRHFSKCGIDNVTPNILEKVRPQNHYVRKAREQYYIELLEPQIDAQ